MKLILKSNTDELCKGAGSPPRAGLTYVTKTVTRGGKTFQQGFWVSQAQAQVSNTKNSTQATTQNNTNASSQSTMTTDVTKVLSDTVSTHGKDKTIQMAQKLGITWKLSSNPNINWMRCAMAVKKWAKQGGDISKLSSGKSVRTKQPSPTSSPQPKRTPNTTVSSTPAKGFDINHFDSLKGSDKDKAMEYAKKAGITWKENSHAGINWMRCAMAVKKHMKNGGTPQPKATPKPQPKTNSTPAVKVPKKNDGQKLVIKPDKQDKQKTYDNIEPDDAKFVPDMYKDRFNKLTQDQQQVALRLGMIGADKQATEYLTSHLYDGFRDQYLSMVQTDTEVKKLYLHEYKGVINKTIKSKLDGVLNKIPNSKKIKVRDLLKPWHYVGSDGLTSSFQSAGFDEIGDEFTGIQCTLNRLRNDPEYAQLAEEYNAKFQQLKDKVGSSTTLQLYDDSKRYSRVMANIDKDIDYYRGNIQVLQDGETKGFEGYHVGDQVVIRDRLGEYKTNKPWVILGFGLHKNSKPTDKEAVYAYVTHPTLCPRRRPECFAYLKDIKSVVSTNNELKDVLPKQFKRLERYSEVKRRTYENNLRARECLKDMALRSEVEKLISDLGDEKFADININLAYSKAMSQALANAGWSMSKPFEQLPMINKSTMDKLRVSDADTRQDLTYQIAAMKPTLTKSGKDTKAIISDLKQKHADNMNLLKAYNIDAGYTSEMSKFKTDLKCSISTAPDSVKQKIIDKIRDDWDTKSHGHRRPTIHGVYEISNLPVEVKFNKLKKERGTNGLFYHGTHSFATGLILGHSGQFQIVKAKVGRMLGDGIYLADKSSKSAQYIGCQFATKNIEGSLMLCEAAMGSKTNNKYKSGDTVQALTTDNAWRSLLNNEWCVRDPEAVLPKYLVHMSVD